MGLFEEIKQRYVEIIDWSENGDGILAYRFPMREREIPTGASLTVRDSQLALFLDGGKIADIFEPGRYTLNFRTLPLLSELKGWEEFFASPFRSDVYFFSTREQLGQKWGTPTPLTVRDVELGPIRIRAHGIFSYRLKNPRVFFEKVSGTSDSYTTQQLDAHLRSIIVSCLRAILGNSQVPFIDLAANQEALCEALKAASIAKFKDYGLKLETLSVQGISLPKELQSHFDKVASMRMVGDVNKYLIFQAAESLTMPGTKETGMNGLQMGLGLGLGLNSILKGLGQQIPPGTPGAPPAAPTDPRKAVGSGEEKTPPKIAKDETDGGTVATLSQLHELHKKGLLTDDEVQAKIAALFKKKSG